MPNRVWRLFHGFIGANIEPILFQRYMNFNTRQTCAVNIVTKELQGLPGYVLLGFG